jgi:hypothetical protein
MKFGVEKDHEISIYYVRNFAYKSSKHGDGEKH